MGTGEPAQKCQAERAKLADELAEELHGVIRAAEELAREFPQLAQLRARARAAAREWREGDVSACMRSRKAVIDLAWELLDQAARNEAGAAADEHGAPRSDDQ